MDISTITQDARTDAADGPVGVVRHVILDSETQQPSFLAIEVTDDGGAVHLIPVEEIDSVDASGVRLRGTREQVRRAPRFVRDDYLALDDEGHRFRHSGRMGAERTSGAQRLQLREEVLRVTKHEEQAGSVSVSKRVVERTETISIPVREERLVIERTPGDGRVLVGDRELREGESVEITLLGERVNLAKEAVVAEEVTVRKEAIEREQPVQATLEREELSVEQRGDVVIEGPQPPPAGV